MTKKYYKIYNEKLNFQFHPVMTSERIIRKYRKDLSATIFHFCPKSPKVIFDIGANMGVYTCLMAKYYQGTAHIYSFEPVEFNFDRLGKNIKLNKLSNVSVFNFGFSSEEKIAKLGIPIDRDDIDNTGLYTYKGDIKNVVECKLKKLNEFIVSNNIEEIDIMKVDVEGAEFDILSSSEDILDRIKYLYLELNKELNSDNYRTIDLLKKNNLHLIKNRGGNYLFGSLPNF